MRPVKIDGPITYRGHRTPRGCVVTYSSENPRWYKKPLPKRLDLANHSPSGFEWGYLGSGPAQLSLALLAHATGDDELASRLHQKFKFERIGKLAQDAAWLMTADEIRIWVAVQFADDNVLPFNRSPP
jgi:Family of unknown function (DUF6166)